MTGEPFMFDELVGNQRAKEILRRMLGMGRVPGALLFAGGDGLGKKWFAIELARALNCRSPRGVEGCGVCVSCTRTGKISFPAADDDEANRRLIWTEHGDVALVRPAKRTITIAPIRELERETNFRPYEGRARVFIIEDADRLNEPASNALLKTLEEAQATSHIILVSSRPMSLLPTIRSRCQTIRFAPLTVREVEEYLIATKKRVGEEARLAAHLSGGRLGYALDINLDAYREQREMMFTVLESLAATNDRSRLLRVAEELSDAKRKDEYEPRLNVLEILVRDLWLLTIDPADASLTNYDLRERLSRLSVKLRSTRAARWLTRIEELRAQLSVNVNRRVATDALFLAMAAD